MKYPTVRKLYKYRTLRVDSASGRVVNELLISSIAKEGIWIAKPNTFNDPFDCNLRPLNLGGGFDEKLSEIMAEIKLSSSEYFNELCSSIAEGCESVSLDDAKSIVTSMFDDEHGGISREYTRQVVIDKLWLLVQSEIDKLGVLCLSEDADNPLLWAHYADNHRGFCIEFERDEGNVLGDNTKTFPVKYSNTYPDLMMSNFFISNSHVSDKPMVGMLEDSYAGSLLLTKSDHWSYENEWRVICEGNNFLAEYPGRILSIIFGLRMPLEDREILMECYGEGVRYREVVMKRGSFSLQIENLN